MTPKVFDILLVLVMNAGHLVTREELLRNVWPDTFIEEANLSRSVSLLRKMLGDAAGSTDYIETIPKSGYRFVADVTIATIESTPAQGARIRTASLPGVTAVIGLVVVSVLGYVIWNLSGSTGPGRIATLVPQHRQVTFTGTDGSPAISPDGGLIAYVSDDPPQRHVMVRELEGGPPMRIATSDEAGMLRWSPDGSRLMFFLRGPDRNGIYVAPRSGGPLQRVASGPLRSSWSPDGATIATAQAHPPRVVLTDLATSARRVLTLEGQHAWMWDIDWSPAGTRLLIVSQATTGKFSILTLHADGSHPRRLLDDSPEIPTARWSPQGDAIYYYRRVDQTASIFKLRLSATNEANAAEAALVTGLESDGLFEISAGGRRLAYARAPFYSNLWVVDVTHGPDASRMTSRQLTRGTSQIERPSVSPDGTSVLFSIGRDAVSNLYTLPLAGGAPRQVTFLNTLTTGGVWSPDGKQVAFASTEGGPKRIWVTDPTGGALRGVSTGDVSESYELTWATRTALFYQQAGNRDFYVVDPERGGGETMLWHRDQPLGWLFSPTVSPDGQRIAAFWNRPQGRGVWVLHAATGEKALLVSDEQADALPLAWSRDGRRLFLVSGERAAYRGVTVKLGETTRNTRVSSVPVAGGPVTTVAVLPFAEVGGLTITPDGKHIVCAVYTSRSDVWIVDQFDPEVKAGAGR
jgi:Tol biopolymer transport system component/DNA-binding winged helix-turn-helix (wHTH) protein